MLAEVETLSTVRGHGADQERDKMAGQSKKVLGTGKTLCGCFRAHRLRSFGK